MMSPSDVRRDLDPFRIGKTYTMSQAAKLAGTTPTTVRRWLLGYQVPGHQMVPVFGQRRRERQASPVQVSFLELAEIVVVARFRKGIDSRRPVKLDRLRRAHEFARKRLGLQYPFASLRLREFGGHLLHEFDTQEPGQGLLALDIGGQWVLPGAVRGALDQFDFADDDFATRWFPEGRNVPIVVDPRIAGGRPTIAGTAVTVDIIRNRFRAGESIRTLAHDYDLRSADVEQALRYAAAA